MAGSLRLYRLAPRTLILAFIVLGVVDAALRFGSAVIADAVDGDSLVLTFGLVIPVVIAVATGSVGVSIAGVVLADRLAGLKTETKDVIAGSFPWREVLAGGLFASIVALVLSVLIAPIILLILPMLFGPPLIGQIIALEGDRLQGALSRARSLSKGSTARILGVMFTIALGVGLLQFTLTQTAFALTEPIQDTVQLALVLVFSIFVQAVLYPYMAAAGLIAYLDVRARSENYGERELSAERRATP